MCLCPRTAIMDWPERESFVIWATNAVIGVFLVITSVAVGRCIRRQFRTRVNCWFCNKNTWVPYLDKDKWNCPCCEQYNGFTADGDYNVELRAQYSPKYNKQAQGNGLHLPNASTNQLCAPCNRNQELKIHQLASFAPTNEATYDAEVELYKEQLEEVYRLCPACERIVKRKLNQAKTLILGLKRSNVKNRSEKAAKKSFGGFGAKLKRFIEHVLIFSVVILLAQYFLSLWLVDLIQGLTTSGFNLNLLTFLWTDYGLDNLGYRLALGITILVLLGRGEPMTSVEYISVLSLCCLHFLIGEQLLHQWNYFPDHLSAIEWTLRVIALSSSVFMFVESLRRSPTSSVRLNNSFHRIEVEDEEEHDYADNSSSIPRRGRCLDTSSDFGSVFESVYQQAQDRTVAPEDEEIRSISLNSSRRSFHNKSDPVLRGLYQPSERATWSAVDQNPLTPPRPSISTTNLFMNSPSKLLHSDDRFSNSIKSMRIGGEYHQIQSPTPNPFMKHIPLSGSGSSTNTLRCSSRSLLTPSRLSLVSGNSGFQSPREYRNSSWLAGGFWNHPNVFTARTPSTVSSFACTNKVMPTPTKGLSSYSYSVDNGLNERFVPLTESRSSSQSSGFESRQSTSSCQLPVAFSPIGGLSVSPAQESLFNDQASVLSAPWSELKGSQLSRRPPTSSSWSTCDTMGMGAFLQPNVFPR